MSLEIKFSILRTDDGKQFGIKELTGTYSSLNAGGWEAPNPPISSALTAIVELWKRNSDGTYTEAPIPSVAVYPDLPNVDGVLVYLSAEDFGYGTGAVFSDGIYKIKYSGTGDDGSPYTFEKQLYFVFDHNACSCYKKLAAKKCGCNDSDKLNMVARLMRSLHSAAECCGDLNSAQETLDKLTKICAQCGCGC